MDIFRPYPISSTVQAVIAGIMQSAASLASTFPNLDRLRVVIHPSRPSTPNYPWKFKYWDPSAAMHIAQIPREEQVTVAQVAIQSYQANHTPNYIPLQLELVEELEVFEAGMLNWPMGGLNAIEDTIFCEAFRNARDEQLPPTITTTKENDADTL
jgi:hypothetical protein